MPLSKTCSAFAVSSTTREAPASISARRGIERNNFNVLQRLRLRFIDFHADPPALGCLSRLLPLRRSQRKFFGETSMPLLPAETLRP